MYLQGSALNVAGVGTSIRTRAMPCIAIGNDDADEEQSVEKVGGRHFEREEEGEDGEDGEDEDDEVPAKTRVAIEEPRRRIVFLDIDGVLNSRQDSRFVLVEGGPCALLRRLLEASEAELVLTTPWRQHHQYISEVLSNFGVFGDANATAEPPVLERTPRHGDGDRPDLEILHWLVPRRNSVSAWVALDSKDLLRWPSASRLEGHTVRVDQGRGGGLGPAEVEAALKALGCSPELLATAPLPMSPMAATLGGALSSSANPAPILPGFRPPAWASAAAAVGKRAGPQTSKAAAGDVCQQFKAALAWDEELSAKMEDVLSALATSSGRSQGAHAPRFAGSGRGSEVTSTAEAVDARMAERMEAVLGCLQDEAETRSAAAGVPCTSPDAAPPPEKVAAGTGEFDSIMDTARQRFGV